MSMKCELLMKDLTYGELYKFVAAAQAAGVGENEAVLCLGSDGKGDRFSVDLSPDARPGDSTAVASQISPAAPADTPSVPEGMRDFFKEIASSETDMERVMTVIAEIRKYLR